MEEVSEMPAGGEVYGGKGLQCFPDPSGTSPQLPFFDHILENVLENVLYFLTSRRDRNAASLVCKSWCRAEAQTRIELFIGNLYAVSPSRAIDRFRRVRSLVLKGKPRLAGLNVVPLEWQARFTPWLTAMAPAYPWLEQICLKRVMINDDDLFLLACSFPCFRDLSLISCCGFSTAGLAIITKNCRYDNDIHLNTHTYFLSHEDCNDDLRRLDQFQAWFSSFRNLRSLDLIETDVDDGDEAMDWVSMFPPGNTCLESLVFDCVAPLVNFEALASLVARSPFLWRLRVNDQISIDHLCQLMFLAPQITDLGTGSFATLGVARDVETDFESVFHAFESLSCLSGFRNIDPEYLHTIHPVCAHLTSLNFSYALISPKQLGSVIIHCHNLETLWILDSVGDEGLQMVAASCKKLKKLMVFPQQAVFPYRTMEDLEGSVSNIGLVAISAGCQNLRSISYFCYKMTNSAVVTMSKNCQELVVFRLCIIGHRHRPHYLTEEAMDEGFGAIVKNCKNLTKLYVSGHLTDKGFAYIGKYGKLLRTLSVAFEGNSDLSLRYLLQGCPKLQKLEIRSCPFGDAGLLSLINHGCNLRFLWMCSRGLSLNVCEKVARALPQMVVEVIKDPTDVENDSVKELYMYRSLVSPRNDDIRILLFEGAANGGPFYSVEAFSLDLVI
ncbi:Transport inhibitor response 1-like protein [Platanthera guangdongensis]|uniref:Transport inhibitor response 1-like protein n=1 Tax=Platanthera guangdongensis TaxID=2320717 RepID=A0ABR2M787_9ASPA